MAKEKEIYALEESNTWNYAILPSGKTALHSKWVYKIKCHTDRNVEWYKARLVILDSTQVEWEDFHGTFSSLPKMTTV